MRFSVEIKISRNYSVVALLRDVSIQFVSRVYIRNWFIWKMDAIAMNSSYNFHEVVAKRTALSVSSSIARTENGIWIVPMHLELRITAKKKKQHKYILENKNYIKWDYLRLLPLFGARPIERQCSWNFVEWRDLCILSSIEHKLFDEQSFAKELIRFVVLAHTLSYEDWKKEIERERVWGTTFAVVLMCSCLNKKLSMLINCWGFEIKLESHYVYQRTPKFRHIYIVAVVDNCKLIVLENVEWRSPYGCVCENGIATPSIAPSSLTSFIHLN